MFTLKEAKTEKKIFSMKNWDTNELRQRLPSSSLGSSSLEWIVVEPKKVELFLHSSSLAAWPFQKQYSSKLWHLLQKYVEVFFDHKSLVAAIQV